MAKSTTRRPKNRSVAQFPQPNAEFSNPTGAVAVAELPEEFREEAAPQPAPPQPPPPASRNPLKKKPGVLPPDDGDFFKRVAAVPQADWDSGRVYLYLYVLEPLCNLKQQGGRAYFNRYSAPIRDEHQIAVECGSGRYRLMLAYNRVSAEDSSEIARYEFEIYNKAYPPTVPRAAWINDPRNAKWEALLPKEQLPGAASSLMEGARFYKEVRDELKEEMEPEMPPSDQTRSTLETMKLAKELFGPPAATATATPADPFDTAKKIMDMRGNDPMIAALMQRLDAADKAQEKAREREFELMKELRQTAQAPPAKPFLEQLLEMATNDKLEPIKKVVSMFMGNGDGPVRGGRTSVYDVIRDVASTPFGAQVGQGLGMMLANFATTSQQQPANGAHPPAPIPLNAQQTNGAPPPIEHPEQRINRIGQQITKPLITAFMRGTPGSDFAQSMFDLMPEDYAFMRSLGAPNIIERYRRFPEAWSVISYKEAEFVEWMTEFCSWDPNEDGGPAPGEGDDGFSEPEGQEAGS